MKHLIVVFSLLLLTVTAWLLAVEHRSFFLFRIYSTLLWLTVIHLFFKVVLEYRIAKKIKDDKTRFEFSRIVSILYVVLLLLVSIRVWVEDTQVLLVSYGLIAAGVTVALQDFFKNLMGGLIIFTTGTYRVGDRIEINSKMGDIIDIGILNTTLFELKEWVNADQPTGRISTIPNSVVLDSVINNYSKDNPFIWDEIILPITYHSDWKGAHERIMGIVREETLGVTLAAQEQISGLSKKYYLSEYTQVPAIYLRMTDNWIDLSIRYITLARQRRYIHDRLSRLILEDLQKDDRITIASATMDITVRSPGAY
ncbi:mechanosensitive ion channel domain-containing protein [Methanolobus chelungpuianus]|uniref:Mechanosensitive ion channel protein MscS n=1 Tax=Methanolobus chelungpuianus TaxID=502115 RepID=A0AAE3KYG1_9EURY|nr:mechanosensitive ion channel domain-containing protein [Methanolobus chelungpuianus]MCQ6962989.1 mechanosensitive ion channel protein MscS [Methanolobus chelungpuianus]